REAERTAESPAHYAVHFGATTTISAALIHSLSGLPRPRGDVADLTNAPLICSADAGVGRAAITVSVEPVRRLNQESTLIRRSEHVGAVILSGHLAVERSEERRVGKEGRWG